MSSIKFQSSTQQHVNLVSTPDEASLNRLEPMDRSPHALYEQHVQTWLCTRYRTDQLRWPWLMRSLREQKSRGWGAQREMRQIMHKDHSGSSCLSKRWRAVTVASYRPLSWFVTGRDEKPARHTAGLPFVHWSEREKLLVKRWLCYYNPASNRTLRACWCTNWDVSTTETI